MPPCFFKNSDQTPHQLPACSPAPAIHSVCDAAPPSRNQWLRFFFAAGLMTPAMWPDAPSTNVLFSGLDGFSNASDRNAASHGTMWSSFEP